MITGVAVIDEGCRLEIDSNGNDDDDGATLDMTEYCRMKAVAPFFSSSLRGSDGNGKFNDDNGR